MEGRTLGGSTGVHTGWVTGIAWSPESAFHLFSCALDGEAKVWDVRASVPLHTLKAHDDKVCRSLPPQALVSSRRMDRSSPFTLGRHGLLGRVSGYCIGAVRGMDRRKHDGHWRCRSQGCVSPRVNQTLDFHDPLVTIIASSPSKRMIYCSYSYKYFAGAPGRAAGRPSDVACATCRPCGPSAGLGSSWACRRPAAAAAAAAGRAPQSVSWQGAPRGCGGRTAYGENTHLAAEGR